MRYMIIERIIPDTMAADTYFAQYIHKIYWN